MVLDALDQLAAAVAATLDDGRASPDELAARAYDLAQALLEERERRRGEGFAPLIDALPHQPVWELTPRWRLADREALDAAERALAGPGLARVRPADEGDAAQPGAPDVAASG